MKKIPVWWGRPPNSMKMFTKDNSMYDECMEAEQQAMISYFLAVEYFWTQLGSEMSVLYDKQKKIWDDAHPTRAAYLKVSRESTALRREIYKQLQDAPHMRQWICPVTMPKLYGYFMKETT